MADWLPPLLLAANGFGFGILYEYWRASRVPLSKAEQLGRVVLEKASSVSSMAKCTGPKVACRVGFRYKDDLGRFNVEVTEESQSGE